MKEKTLAYSGGMLRHVSLTLLGYGGQLAMTLLAAILSAQLLGPHARGELAAIQMMTLTLFSAAAFGTPQALTYYTAREPKRAGDFLGARLVLSLAACVPFVLGGLLLQHYLLEGYRPEITRMAAFYLVMMMPGLMLVGAPTNTFLALKDYVRFNLTGLVSTALYFAAIVTALVRLDPLTIALAYIIFVFGIGVPVVALMYETHVGQPIRYRLADVRQMFGYAAFTFMSTLPQVVGQRLDQIVVLARLDASSLGLYTIAAGVGQMFQTLQLAAGSILLPYLAGDERDTAGKTRLFGQVVRVTFVLSALLVGGLLVVLPVLVPLMFGKDFAPAIPAAALLIGAAAVQGINTALGDGFRGLNMPKIPLYTELAGIAIKALALAGVMGWGWGLTLEHAALTVVAGAVAALLGNLVFYSVKVERIGWRWFWLAGLDVKLVVRHVWERGNYFITKKSK